MVAATMSVASATSIDTFWLEDRPDAFALTMIGTGLSAFGTFVSPSGQWSLQGGYSGRYFPDGEVHHVQPRGADELGSRPTGNLFAKPTAISKGAIVCPRPLSS